MIAVNENFQRKSAKEPSNQFSLSRPIITRRLNDRLSLTSLFSPPPTKIPNPEIFPGVFIQPEFNNYLTITERKDLIERTNKARFEHNKATAQIKRAEIIRKYFQYDFDKAPNRSTNPEYLTHPVFIQLVKDAERGSYEGTRALISKLKPNFLIGVFQASYVPELAEPSLEAIVFDKVDLNTEITEKFPSNAVAISTDSTNFAGIEDYVASSSEGRFFGTKTEGLTNKVCVAIFPEMFSIQNEKIRQGEECDAYYFVDTFIDRFQNYTLPLIKVHFPELYEELRDMSPQQLRTAIAAWLTGHEHFHTSGDLPRVFRPSSDIEKTINKIFGFSMKNKFETGAEEEMRVDIKTLLSVLGPLGAALYGSKDAKTIWDFILAERIVRYIAQKDPDQHFDSVVGMFLYHYLTSYKDPYTREAALKVNNKNQLSFGKCCANAIAQLDKDIQECERKVAAMDLKNNFSTGREALVDFMRSYGRPPKQPKDEAVDREYITNYNQHIAKLNATIKKPETTDTEKSKLKDQIAKLKKEYFNRFYPLTPFHLALRKTYENLPIVKNTRAANSQVAAKAIVEPNPNDNVSELDSDPVVINGVKDISEIFIPHESEPSRDFLDTNFVLHLKRQAESSSKNQIQDLESPESCLQILAVKNNFNDIDRRLIYFAYLDYHQRLNIEQTKLYQKFLERSYAKQLKKINESEEQKKFISRLKRVFRYKVSQANPELVIELAKIGKELLKKISGRRIFFNELFEKSVVGASLTGLIAAGEKTLTKSIKTSGPRRAIHNSNFAFGPIDARKLYDEIEAQDAERILTFIKAFLKDSGLAKRINVKVFNGDAPLIRDGVELVLTCSANPNYKKIKITDNEHDLDIKLPSFILNQIADYNNDSITKLIKSMIEKGELEFKFSKTLSA